jgi:ABC-2 type transport system ATP-binding protein
VPFIELGVGFNGDLTGRENIYLNGALLGFSEKEINAKYQDIVDFAELERFMDQKLKNYSSGMQVRLAFSVATRLAESDVLLIDEVLAVGDADFQRKCFAYFQDLKKQKKTVVFVSHDMNAVREYCDRALLINNSRLISIGSTDKIATEYTRMFMREKQEKSNVDKNELRWGEGQLRYKNVSVTPKIIKDGVSEVIIKAE